MTARFGFFTRMIVPSSHTLSNWSRYFSFVEKLSTNWLNDLCLCCFIENPDRSLSLVFSFSFPAFSLAISRGVPFCLPWCFSRSINTRHFWHALHRASSDFFSFGDTFDVSRLDVPCACGDAKLDAAAVDVDFNVLHVSNVKLQKSSSSEKSSSYSLSVTCGSWTVSSLAKKDDFPRHSRNPHKILISRICACPVSPMFCMQHSGCCTLSAST